MRPYILLTFMFVAVGALPAADIAPVKPTLSYATKPGDGPWLTGWIAATQSPVYALATAHEPQFADKTLWPEVTDEDGTPAYKTQIWPRTRLLVWNRRDDERAGKQIDVIDPANWLENGKPATDGPDAETDIIFPSSEKPYWVSCSAGDKFQRGFPVRHITVGANAIISLFGLECNGNWWVRKGGSIYERHGGAFMGKFHTFARNDNTPAWRPCPNPRPPGKTLEEWPFTQESSQYFWIVKPGGSVEVVGNVSSQDQFHVNKGSMIVGPNSYLGTGGRATLTIEEEGVVQLQSGSAVAKLWAQTFTTDIDVKGILRAGSVQRPIHRDCMVGLSAKDYIGEAGGGTNENAHRVGLFVHIKGTIEVYQAKPEACMRIQWSGVPLRSLRESSPKADDREFAPWHVQRAAAERFSNTITVDLRGDLALSHVRFDDLRPGGLYGPDLAAIKAWKDVTFGERNMGSIEQLIAYSDWWTSLQILPVGPLASLPAGKPTLCEIRSCQPESATHYTIDGSEPTVTSPRYDKPFPLIATTIVKARLFYEGRPQGTIARSDFFSVEKPLPASTSGGKQPGLAFVAGTQRERNGIQVMEGKAELSKPSTGVAETIRVYSKDPAFDANFALTFTGFIDVPKDGTYSLWITCADHPAAHVRFGDLRVCDKGLNRGRTDGHAISLSKGPHPLAIDYLRSYWGDETLKFEWEGPGIIRQEVPASAFTH